MANDSRVSSGEFDVPRFRLRVREEVKFSPEIEDRFNVIPVIDLIAGMEVNPCAECTTILDLVRLLASRSGVEPEEMGIIKVECKPDEHNADFYEVLGLSPDGTSQVLTSVRCQLVPWMLQNLASDQDK